MTTRRGGRKRIEIDLEKVEQLAAQGLTEQQICDCMGIGKTAFYERKAQFTELADAVKRGKAKGIEFVTNKLFEQCQEGNTTAILFYLKARAHWRDRDPVEFNATDAPVTINFKRGSDADD